jgi:hypothetical protein
MSNVDQWLTDYLAEHGPVSSAQVKRDGAAAGYPARTLQRAMTRIPARTIGRGPATRWALSVTANRPTTAPQPGQDPAIPSTTRADGAPVLSPACPSCGGTWSIMGRMFPGHWWCPTCGTSYPDGATHDLATCIPYGVR